MDMTLFFAGLYLSEGWYEHWRVTGSLHSKARAMVLFDSRLSERPKHGQLKERLHCANSLPLARMVGHKDLNELQTYYNATAEELATKL